jgi:hypothetical protein
MSLPYPIRLRNLMTIMRAMFPEFPAGGLALMAGGFRAPAGGPRRASQRGRQPAPTRIVEWQWRPGDVVRWRDYEGKVRRVDAEHAFVEINGSCSG